MAEFRNSQGSNISNLSDVELHALLTSGDLHLLHAALVVNRSREERARDKENFYRQLRARTKGQSKAAKDLRAKCNEKMDHYSSLSMHFNRQEDAINRRIEELNPRVAPNARRATENSPNSRNSQNSRTSRNSRNSINATPIPPHLLVPLTDYGEPLIESEFREVPIPPADFSRHSYTKDGKHLDVLTDDVLEENHSITLPGGMCISHKSLGELWLKQNNTGGFTDPFTKQPLDSTFIAYAKTIILKERRKDENERTKGKAELKRVNSAEERGAASSSSSSSSRASSSSSRRASSSPSSSPTSSRQTRRQSRRPGPSGGGRKMTKRMGKTRRR